MKMKFVILVVLLFFTIFQGNSLNKIAPKSPFKAFLKSNNISMDIDVPNKFETLQPGNKYSNYYFGVNSMFPKDWGHDRGQSEYSLFRALNLAKSSVIALIAIPTENQPSNSLVEKFQESPMRTMNQSSGGDYKKKLYEEFSQNTNMKISNFSLSEEFIASTNYLKYEYEFYLVSEGSKKAYKTLGYQVIQRNVTFTILYTTPVKYFEKENILLCLQNTFYKYVN